MRAIDADALMKAINTWPKFGVDERCRIVPWDEGYEPYIHLRDAVIAITGMPTIEERKKGEWIDDKRLKLDGTFHWFRKCDQCDYERTDDNPDNDGNYCPNCGADMRGDSDD